MRPRFPALLLAALVAAPLAAAEPETVAALLARGKAGDTAAVLELGRRGDRSVLPDLRGLVEKGRGDFTSMRAQAALAKLGDAPSFAALETAARDERGPSGQNEAVKLIEYVGGKRAVAALAGLLDQDKLRKDEPRGWVSCFPTTSAPAPSFDYKPLTGRVIPALAALVPNPPTPGTNKPTPEQVAAWRRWWQENKARYR